MARNFPSYIRAWRQHRGLTQEQLVERLAEIAGDAGEAAGIPLTAVSISRIENGKQNFSMTALHAIARALEVEEPGWLLDRDPAKEGQVISLLDRLDDRERAQAAAVLEAMFGTGAA